MSHLLPPVFSLLLLLDSFYEADCESSLILAVTREAFESIASRFGVTAPKRDLTFLDSEPNSRDIRGDRGAGGILPRPVEMAGCRQAEE